LEAILMSHLSRRRCAALLVASALLLSACGHATLDAAPADSPVQVSPVPGSDLKSVALSEQSSARLGIRTAPVAPAATAAAGLRQVPYSAIVYDDQGATWTFVPTAPRTYVREPVAVDHIAGDVAVLSAGPAVGALVVTEGSQELLGAEYDISGEG
jgi:hypothetical protein